ncbi:sulfite exporter TauE/SafE family protein [Aureimonas mangrovi]|uniref:sulfite exporter TauE/SafE family protein n=1 Tax=Aureimonas mangrovi TaxID=2758041 RepID=UPI00163D475C|nr:sulfite exporter TauE/SafE family protein [Aureimonas mangrovi]
MDISPFGLMNSPLAAALAVAASILVGLSKGGLPIVGMLSVPLLVFAMPPLAAASLILPIYIASDVVGVYLYRHQFSARNLAILVPAAFVGVAIAWATVSIVPERALTGAIGVIGILFCIDAAWKRRHVLPPRPADVPRGLFWGVLLGITSFVANAGAPPFQFYVLPQRLAKMVFAGTSTILFAAVNWMKLFFFWELGQISVERSLFATLVLLPAAIAATFAGAWITRRLEEKAFFQLVEWMLLATSILLLYRAIWGA